MKTNYVLLCEKKSRKRNPGECFYFQFNNGDTLLGVVLYVGLNWGVWYEKKLVVLFFKTKLIESKIGDTNYLKNIICNYENLAIPPRIIDNSGWNHGFYKPFAQIDVNETIAYLNDVTFYNDAFGYTQNVNQDVVKTSNLYLCGIQTIANCYGIETLMEISMDYKFVEKPRENFNPYFYITNLISKDNKNSHIPFWYHKAKERLGNN